MHPTTKELLDTKLYATHARVESSKESPGIMVTPVMVPDPTGQWLHNNDVITLIHHEATLQGRAFGEAQSQLEKLQAERVLGREIAERDAAEAQRLIENANYRTEAAVAQSASLRERLDSLQTENAHLTELVDVHQADEQMHRDVVNFLSKKPVAKWCAIPPTIGPHWYWNGKTNCPAEVVFVCVNADNMPLVKALPAPAGHYLAIDHPEVPA